MTDKPEEQPETEESLLEKAKKVASKLPSLSFTKENPENPSGKRLKGLWITWRF